MELQGKFFALVHLITNGNEFSFFIFRQWSFSRYNNLLASSLISELKHLINLELLNLAQNSFSGPIPVEGEPMFAFPFRIICMRSISWILEYNIQLFLYIVLIIFLFSNHLINYSILWNEESAGAWSEWKSFSRPHSSLSRQFEEATSSRPIIQPI